MLRQMQKLSVTVRCHGRMSRQDVSAEIQSRKSEQKVTAAGEQPFIAKVSQEDVTTGCHGRMSGQDASKVCHSTRSQPDVSVGLVGWS